MIELPQGRKSEVVLLPDGQSVKKSYNTNGDPMDKYCREVGFYSHYGHSGIIPRLLDSKPGEYIVRLEALDETGSGDGGSQCCWTSVHITVHVSEGAQLTGQ